MDIESAFSIVPVHTDRPLLGMKRDNQFYIDCTLPSGLRSAPEIFNSNADVLEWILKAIGAKFIYHYLDDYLLS